MIPGCRTEPWVFDSPAIENPRSWGRAPRSAPALDRLIASVSSGGRREPARARRDDTIAHHVMSASDPVDAISGGSAWRAERALGEFAKRMSLPSAQVAKVVSGADPFLDEASAAYSDVCGALGVGLVVQNGSEIRVIRICPDKNVWLQRGESGGWSAADRCKNSVGRGEIEAMIRERCASAAKNPGSSIKELRHYADHLGIPRPHPRTKSALANVLLAAAADAPARGQGRVDDPAHAEQLRAGDS